MVLTLGKLTIRLWEYEYGKSETTSTLAFSFENEYFPTRFGLPSHTKTLENKTNRFKNTLKSGDI